MDVSSWLIDKSALARLSASQDAQEWSDRVQRALVHVCAPTLLEIGFSAVSGSDWHRLIQLPPIKLMPIVSITSSVESRALEVQGLLARTGHHRAPSIPDLLIAAVAEMHGLTVLHCDKDFDLIADITGQPTQWLN